LLPKKSGCPVGYKKLGGKCVSQKRFVSRGVHEKGEMFIRQVRPGKYIAFYLSFEDQPKVEGLTVPISKKEMRFHFNIDVDKARKKGKE
jgi:hypothetical protein